jgi:hypothetical protein
MKLRLLGASAVAGMLAMSMASAHATPYAGQFSYLATGSVAFQGADGARWLLAVTATASGAAESRPEQRLYLDLSRCAGSSCVAVGKWSRPLTPAEVAITAPQALVETQASATLRTVLGGVPLDISLTGGTVGGGAFEGLGSSTSPPGISPAVSQYTAASGQLTFAGMRCAPISRGAEIGRRTMLDTIGDDERDPRGAPPARLPAGFLTGKARPHC